MLLSFLFTTSFYIIFRNRHFCSYLPYAFTCVFFLFFLSFFHLTTIAFCEPENIIPFIPRVIPAQPAPPPVPAPIIPVLVPPLLSYEARSSILYQRYLFLNWGRDNDLIRMVAIIEPQITVELYVEAALVDDGFNPQSILYRYRDIRGWIHSPQGELLGRRTYESYVTQIRSHGTRSSVPYRRVRRAIQNYDLLLE